MDVYFRHSRAWQEKSHPQKLMCSVICLVPAIHMSCLVWLCSCIVQFDCTHPIPTVSLSFRHQLLLSQSPHSCIYKVAPMNPNIYISAFSTYHLAKKIYLQFVFVSLFYSSLLLCLDFFPSNSAKKPPFLSNPPSTLHATTLLRSFPPHFSQFPIVSQKHQEDTVISFP